MATSRTGTARWKQVRAKVIQQALRDGIENCPRCGVQLDYTPGQRKRNSVEVDHIVPHSQGGADSIQNSIVICSRCNKSLGAKNKQKQAKNKMKSIRSVTLETSRSW